MIIVTGGAGFIGSAVVRKLNLEGIDDVLIVDELDDSQKWKNLRALQYDDYLDKNEFLDLIHEDALPEEIEAVIHMGACSSTDVTDSNYVMQNNYAYTQNLALVCASKGIRFIYASSAATYGDGENGFVDNQEELHALRPLNVYGYSKHRFDCFAEKHGLLDHIVGLKFFNVFGPNEYHKGNMLSAPFWAYNQIQDKGSVTLLKSHNPDFKDGEQKRDFIYVKDVADTIYWLLENTEVNGLFNLGTGSAHSWKQVVEATFEALDKKPKIEYVAMSEEMQGRYQYFTEASMEKLKAAGCPLRFTPLKEAVADYISYLDNKTVKYLGDE